MHKLIVCFALTAGGIFAQDLTGSWQGTLQGPRELRVVMKLAAVDGAIKGTLYSIDQAGPGLPISAVTREGVMVKILIPGIGGTFEGKLNSDGNIMAGTWAQGGPQPIPLTLTLATAQTAWAIPTPPPPPKPMAADANPVFEVATIKPSRPDAQGRGFRVQGRQFTTLNTSLADIITFAYGVHPRQILGGPAWMENDKWDITAKPDGEGQPNDKQWKAMVQKLLAERFQLAFHSDKKELSVYAIVQGKGGHKLTKSEADPNGLPGMFFRGYGSLPARNANMADLARLMQGAVLDRPVVDQTGITGRFDFTLDWQPDEFQFNGAAAKAPPPPEGQSRPDLFTAFQEQLGLKLESTKAPAEVFVIDKAEKPSEN